MREYSWSRRIKAEAGLRVELKERWPYSPKFIDDMKHHADIVVVIQDYVSLKRRAKPTRSLSVPRREDAVVHVTRDKGFFTVRL